MTRARRHERSVAVSVISGTLASAFESGQSRFAAFAISWTVASLMPGTVACIVIAIPVDHEAFALA